MRRALIIAWLVAGCGFTPQDSFTGTRVGDGIAPWQDLGPVQICFGNEFIGPPATDAGGLCADRNTTQEPCISDDDCRSRESCVCGRCTVQYCTTNSDCGAGRVCSFAEKRCDRTCARDDDCPLSDICYAGTCRGQCETDADCQTGEVCNSVNRCITVACSTDGDCLNGESCRIQRVPRLAREPSVLARETRSEPRFTMWMELSNETQMDRRAIWRATSRDGVHYQIDPAQPVLEDGLVAGAPSVLRTPDGFGLYYELGDGEAIRYASSADGISFGAPSTVITGGALAAGVHGPSAVLLPSGQLALYYEAGDGASIDLAAGTLGQPLGAGSTVLTLDDVRDPPANPDDPAAQFWLEIQALRSPHALVTAAAAGPSLSLWFSAFGRESGDSQQFGETIPIDPNYSIGYAAAPDPEQPDQLVPWDFNPVLDRVEVFLDHRSELSPAAVQVTDPDGTPRDGYLLYYLDAQTSEARGATEIGRLGVAGNGTFPTR